jgi:hypothetical protein
LASDAEMNISKQSLLDWHVTDDKGKGVAWIAKVRLPKSHGAVVYEVRLKIFDYQGPRVFRYFKEAKEYAMDPLNAP